LLLVDPDCFFIEQLSGSDIRNGCVWQSREEDEAIASAIPFATHRQEINKQTKQICCHSLVCMTGTNVPLWDLGIVSLFGITAGSWAALPSLDIHVSSLLQIWSGCWFFVPHPNFPQSTLLRLWCRSWGSNPGFGCFIGVQPNWFFIR